MPTSDSVIQYDHISSNGGISTGAIVGIVVGSTVGLALLLTGAVVFWRNKQQKKKDQNATIELDSK